jgi:hypothetical protein
VPLTSKKPKSLYLRTKAQEEDELETRVREPEIVPPSLFINKSDFKNSGSMVDN